MQAHDKSGLFSWHGMTAGPVTCGRGLFSIFVHVSILGLVIKIKAKKKMLHLSPSSNLWLLSLIIKDYDMFLNDRMR